MIKPHHNSSKNQYFCRFPSLYRLHYTYNNGSKTHIRENNSAGITIWQLGSVNAMGQELNSTVLGRSKTQTYNVFGQPTRMTLQGLMDYTYTYDLRTGNMLSRRNPFNGQNETFTYDALNRLTTGVTFSLCGNILSKEGVGNFVYDPVRRHAVERIYGPLGLSEHLNHDITYTSFQKVNTILNTNDGLFANFIYGPNRQRRQMYVFVGNDLIRKYYTQNFEQIFINGNRKETKEYIFSPFGLIAIRNNGQINAVATDHLGSIVARFNPRVNDYEFFGYTAWGRRYHRTSCGTNLFFDEIPPNHNNPIGLLNYFARGFTGHEHLDAFGLINMNGRLYDPTIGRFLSPDPFVPDATFTQDFNRYMYARNNPLSYIDPTGEFVAEALFGLAFFSNVLGNLVTGTPNPIRTAHNDARLIYNDVNFAMSWLQVPVYSNNNTTVSVGFNPFAIGLSVNVAHTRAGGTTFHGGAGIGVTGFFFSGGASQQVGNWNIGGGIGGGNNHWGWNANVVHNSGFGLGYGWTRYGGVHAQTTGSANLIFPGGSFRIENDFLRFDGQDRWRTSAWELSIGNWSIGSYVYTNDPKGLGGRFDEDGRDLLGNRNKRGLGAWTDGQVYSSPLWIGHRSGNTISRIGFNHPMVQDRTQNWVHRNGFFYLPFGRQRFFNRYDYFRRGWYGHSGFHNPFSLFGR